MKLGISKKEVIQVISDVGHTSSYLQADNQFGCPIWEKWLPHMKRHGWVIKSQSITMEQSNICILQL